MSDIKLTEEIIEEKNRLANIWASNFRNLISVKQCTQKELADLVGVTQSRVAQWSKGSSLPPLNMAARIADLFNTTVSEMIGEVDADAYENSTRYHISDEVWDRKPAIDKEELEAMELLHGRSIIDDEKYYGYIAQKLKEIAE